MVMVTRYLREKVLTFYFYFCRTMAQACLNNEKFHHIDLRNILDTYTDWCNELHLKNSTYAKAADAMHEAIVQI